MRFTVTTRSSTGTEDTEYEGRYKILDNGVLIVTPDDLTAKKLTFSPTHWLAVGEDNTPQTRGLRST